MPFVSLGLSPSLCNPLARLGYTDVRRYEAGKDDWVQAGLAVETGAVPVI